MENEIVLDDIQTVAVQRMLSNNKYCLFWDVGVGKTYAVLSRLAMFTTRKRILILAPATSIENMWEREKEADWFGVFANNDVELRGFEWFAWSKKEEVVSKRTNKKYTRTIAANVRELNHFVYDVIVIDEAHRLAASVKQSRTARLVRSLTANAEYVYCLTGTPARNQYSDLFSLMRNASIPVWADYTYDDFVRYFFKGFELHLPHTTVYKPTDLKPSREAEFFNEVNRYCMFAQKQRDWLVESYDIEIKPKKTKAYYQALKGIYQDASGEQQVANSLVGFGKAYMELHGFTYQLQANGENKIVESFINPKLPYITKALTYELTRNRCVLVYYQWKRDFNDLTMMLSNMGIPYVETMEEAEKQTGKFVYLLQLKKGISINLQTFTSVVMFYTFNFSFVDFSQCVGRVDRRGQKNTVRIYRFIFKDSIEKDIVIHAIDTKMRIDYALKTNTARKLIAKEVSEYGC